MNLNLVQEHRTEIEARAGTFQAFEMFGQQLLESNHYASAQVQEKLEAMNESRQELEKFVSSDENNALASFYIKIGSHYSCMYTQN